MNATKIIVAGLVALSSTIVGRAVTGANGDLILGFSASSGTGAATNLEVDLGNVVNFFQADQGGTLAPGQVVDLSSMLSLTDLTNTYGSWQTDSALTWGVVGNSLKNPSSSVFGSKTFKSTIWATEATSAPGASTPWLNGSTSSQNPGVGAIQTVALNIGNGTAAGTPQSVFLASSDPTSWATNAGIGTGTQFLVFPEGSGSVVGATSSGVSYLDLYQVAPTSASGAVTGVSLLGTFALFGDGSAQYLTFTAATPIPEPSTYAAILGAAALGFVMLRRRRLAGIA